MILRPDYIKAVEPYIDAPLVKILSGVRRCGKSTILEMIQDELKNRGIEEERIISKRYTAMDVDENYTSKDMYAELKSLIADKGRCYLFIDEPQEVDNWEKVVNSLFESEDVDIYITGSNSKLMSSEISTYLTGRYVSINCYTLSFKEYLNFKGKSEADAKDMFEEYLQFGGFPIVGISNFDTRSAYQVVDGIYSAVITRDISKRHRIRNKDLFDRVVKYIIENVGKTFSANSIVKFLKNEKRSLSVESIYNYIKWLSEAFIIYPCQRYDLQGKSILKTQEKYYLSDVGFKYSQFGYSPKSIAAILENLVYLELRRRGFLVYIGKLADKKIDFVATKQDQKIYVQVCRTLPEDSDREIGNLKIIKDNYPKYVVTMDSTVCGTDEGIKIIHVKDFLLENNW